MKTTDLEFYEIYVDSETFEVEFLHPEYQTVHFVGEFSDFSVINTYDSGDYFTPPDAETKVNFTIDMQTLQFFDGEGELIKAASKDVIELLEDYIEDYIYKNAGELAD